MPSCRGLASGSSVLDILAAFEKGGQRGRRAPRGRLRRMTQRGARDKHRAHEKRPLILQPARARVLRAQLVTG